MYVYLGAVERHFFCARTKDKAVIRHSDLRRLCGFVVLTFFIARPTSRAETAWALLPVKKLNTKLVEGQELSLSFPQHKTQSTYGCLIAKYSDVLSSILLTYLKRIRPVLLKLPEIWGKCSKQLVHTSLSSLSSRFIQGLCVCVCVCVCLCMCGCGGCLLSLFFFSLSLSL